MKAADIGDRTSDVKIWNETVLPTPLKEKPLIADKAYQGAEKPTLTPKKKPKGRRVKRNRKEGKQRTLTRANIC